ALGLDDAVAPGFGLADPDLARRALTLLPADGRRDLTALALASAGVVPDALPALLDRLAFEAAERDAILAATLGGQAIADGLQRAERPSEIAAAAAGAGPEAVAIAGALGPEQPARAWL